MYGRVRTTGGPGNGALVTFWGYGRKVRRLSCKQVCVGSSPTGSSFFDMI